LFFLVVSYTKYNKYRCIGMWKINNHSALGTIL
jgi:hypothetical protein